MLSSQFQLSRLAIAKISENIVQGVPKKSVNKEISITFEKMATQRCLRSHIGGTFEQLPGV